MMMCLLIGAVGVACSTLNNNQLSGEIPGDALAKLTQLTKL